MIVPPGSTIGIVGGGQLGRMLALAAAQLGYKCHIYAPDQAPPAAEVAARLTRGGWDDVAAIRRFGGEVDVATYEFENIGVAAMRALSDTVALHPPVEALEIAQNRLDEKRFAARLGGRPTAFAAVDRRDQLDAALAEVGTPAILKSRRFGYDGKGQARIADAGDADAAWDALRGAPAILERVVDFSAEFSILLCRDAAGEIAIWDAPRNRHAHGMLDTSQVPGGAEIGDCCAEAEALARRLADALGYVGVLAVEFFATSAGPVFNEMAPRVHNSGHWTIEGALTSQFENHIRAICGLPLGATTRLAPRIEMQNLIGDDVERWPDLLSDPTAHVHLYGKGAARPGRKMGHVTRLIG